MKTIRSLLKENITEFLILLLLILSFGLKYYRLTIPPSYYFDEIYYAFTAEEIARGSDTPWGVGGNAPKGFAYEWSHPPLGKLLMAAGILVFGENSFGWRFFPALFGAIATLIIYLLGKELFESKRVGFFAAFLITFESLVFVQSRIAMVDIFIMVFTLLASLFFILYAKKGKLYYILLTGVFCGFTASTKWSGVLTLGFLGLLSLLVEVCKKRTQIVYQKRKKIKVKGPSIWTLSIRMLPKLVLSFIVIPAIVYFLIYLPLFFHNHNWADFIELHKQMYYYHSGLKATHPYQSSWWQWFLLIRPVYLYLGSQGDKAAHIYAIGNPFIWWTGVGFLLYSLIEVARKENTILYFLILSVFAYWVPWSFSPRISFIYHFLPSLSFMLIISAYFLSLIWDKGRYGKIFVLAYLFGSVSFFFYFYPILAALYLSPEETAHRFWISTWR